MLLSTFYPPQVMKFKLLVGVILLLLGIAVGIWFARPNWTVESVRETVVTTLQREAPASFYVTGTLDIATTIQEESQKSIVVPSLFVPLNIDLGRTTVTLRVPGRVSYGFDVRELSTEDIQIDEAGVVTLNLPALSVFSVEAMLEQAEMRTEVGWARLQSRSGAEQERRALARVRSALREQAEAHLADATQPKVNTARALELLLRPALQSAGVDEPSFRIQVANGLVLESEG